MVKKFILDVTCKLGFTLGCSDQTQTNNPIFSNHLQGLP